MFHSWTMCMMHRRSALFFFWITNNEVPTGIEIEGQQCGPFMSKLKKHFFFFNIILSYITIRVRSYTLVFFHIASTSLAPHPFVIHQSSGVSMWLLIGVWVASDSHNHSSNFAKVDVANWTSSLLLGPLQAHNSPNPLILLLFHNLSDIPFLFCAEFSADCPWIHIISRCISVAKSLIDPPITSATIDKML